MPKSWELTDEQKKEHEEETKDSRESYDPQTGNKKETDTTSESEDTENMDSEHERGERERQQPADDDHVR